MLHLKIQKADVEGRGGTSVLILVLIFLWLSLMSAVWLIFCLLEGIQVGEWLGGIYLCPEIQVLQMNQIITGTIVINECLVFFTEIKDIGNMAVTLYFLYGFMYVWFSWEGF